MYSNPSTENGTHRSDAVRGSEPAARQIERLFLDAGTARAALEWLPAEAPVLLVKFADAAAAGAAEEGWESALAQSLLAQAQPSAMTQVLSGPSGLEIHPAARLAFCAGQELSLTSTEFALLQELLSQDGAVVSVDALSRAVWGHDTLGAPNYVEAHISRLRRKLREVGAGRVIETVRGSGYRIRPSRLMPVPRDPDPAEPMLGDLRSERDEAV